MIAARLRCHLRPQEARRRAAVVARNTLAGACRYTSRLRAAVGAAAPPLGSSADEEGEDTQIPSPRFAAFPWRMSNQPEVPGPVKSLKIMLASVIASELMGGLGYADLEFGVKQALTSVTAAVFDLPASAPLLRDMVDDSLAKFYSDATTTARSEGYSLSHTLHKVSSAVLCNVDILTCAKRGFDYSHLVREGTLLGTSYLRVEPPPRGDITYDDWESQPHIKKAAGVHKSLENFGTIRYTFYVTTSETFCVRSATGTVVQGSEAPQEGAHNVILEQSYCRRTNRSSDFMVVDIDSWLEGNKFWVKEKSK